MMALLDRSRKATRSVPLFFSPSTKKQKETSDLPEYGELFENLGLGKGADQKLIARFRKARTTHLEEFIKSNELEKKDLSNWREQACKARFKKMAKYFLWDKGGARFWPEEPSAANKNGYTSHKDGEVIADLLAKLFFLYFNFKRRPKRNKNAMPANLTSSYIATFKAHLKNSGHSVDWPIEVDYMSDYGLHISEVPFVPPSPKREPESDDEDLPAIEDMQTRVQQKTVPVFVTPSSLGMGGPAPAEEPAPAKEPQSTNRQSPSRLQTNEQAKRPAEADLDTQRRTKSPRQNQYLDLFLGMYAAVDDDDSGSFHSQEEGLYSQLEGRANRRTRQKDYGREGYELGPFSSRFGTVDRAVSVNRDPFMMDRLSVAAPIAPMGGPTGPTMESDGGAAENNGRSSRASVVPRRDSFVSSTHDTRSQIVFKPSSIPSAPVTQQEGGESAFEKNAEMAPMEEHVVTVTREERAASHPQSHGDISSEKGDDATASPSPDTIIRPVDVPITRNNPITTSARPGPSKTSPDTPIQKNSPSADGFPLQMLKPGLQNNTHYNPSIARRILSTHLRGYAKETATPIMFSFAVHHRTGHGDRFTFSPFDFFEMSLKEFIIALPMENKGLITGLCIRQYGPRLCLRQVYLYNEEMFGNIREQFLRHVERDIRGAKYDGKRLDYEISIEPLTEGD
ncbi:hypothetical protein DER45DRAFT_611730 [Fusarium avenaceum]|nr:hypothetical protein DER45DRAFT_611730 [Fusarium avenaceum]